MQTQSLLLLQSSVFNVVLAHINIGFILLQLPKLVEMIYRLGTFPCWECNTKDLHGIMTTPAKCIDFSMHKGLQLDMVP